MQSCFRVVICLVIQFHAVLYVTAALVDVL